MKQIATLALAAMLVAGCRHGLAPARLTVGTDSTARLVAPALPGLLQADTAAQASVKEELDYYLQRHNVLDEGFEMVARYAENCGQAWAPRLPEGELSVWNVGRWSGVPRQGVGVVKDHAGRVVIGQWEADTLVYGVRVDTAGVYAGAFRQGMAEGHGTYQDCHGTHYEGHWAADRRDGFGFSLAPGTHLRAGEWKADAYKGERMSYTSERIYGIDISRYQHGKGRKKYAIQWTNVRIRHLGSKSRKQVSGVVDYPVSFAYVKSTEGVSIRNPYFASDYQQAKRQGIRVGAYHFFSTRSSGSAQAQHFLRNTHFHRGDLPPVLDLEPSAGQIAQMGGAGAMFRNVRAWLNAVKARTGARPILYVSQTFVNKYLAQAPDLKRDYHVWIARYGEYKPDVKLAFWQLSPDGRVAGIRGEVDINVFNGYQLQFDDFLDQETIR